MYSDILDRLMIVEGDITRQRVDAVVNAANESLLGGGGVDGAIHRAAGPELLYECKQLGGCPTGSAVATRGYNLPATYIIHTVGPVWRNAGNESDLLRACYVNSIELAVRLKAETMAFPSISTGAFGYPLDLAVQVSVPSILEYLEKYPQLRVTIVCFDERTFETYLRFVRANYSS